MPYKVLPLPAERDTTPETIREIEDESEDDV